MLNSNQDPWGKPESPSPRQPSGQNQRPSQDQSPPDLEEVFNNLLKKIKGKGKGTNGNGRQPPFVSFNFKKLLPTLCVVGGVIWGMSGFYTIKEADRGVVLRFGQLDKIVQPGLNWKPTFIDRVIPVNVEQVNELRTSGSMLTKDENMVKVEMTVQYRVADPAKYLFSVTNANESLMQATDSALRYVIGNMKMDDILTTGRSVVRERTWKAIEQIIAPYHMGLEILDVNFQSARPPEEVKAAFDDAIKAQEDEQRYIREAEAYARAKEPIARGNAQRIVESATAYKQQVLLNAQGEVERYQRLLPSYLADPKLLRERLYLQMMEEIFHKTPKVLLEQGSSLNVLPLEKLLQGQPPTTMNPTPTPSRNKTQEQDMPSHFIQTHQNDERKGRFH